MQRSYRSTRLDHRRQDELPLLHNTSSIVPCPAAAAAELTMYTVSQKSRWLIDSMYLHAIRASVRLSNLNFKLRQIT